MDELSIQARRNRLAESPFFTVDSGDQRRKLNSCALIIDSRTGWRRVRSG
jgi:hypothetical protein